MKSIKFFIALLCLVVAISAEVVQIPPAQNCVVSDWADPDPSSGYLTCSKSCGSGYRTQYRQVLIPAGPAGIVCPELSRTIPCQINPCPVDCVVGEWVPFNSYESYYAAFNTYGAVSRANWRGLCSATCSSATSQATRTLYRTVKTPASNGGLECPPLETTVSCNSNLCPIDGVVSQWSTYDSYDAYLQYFGNQNYFNPGNWGGLCSRTCGGGNRQVFRYVLTYPANGGAALPALFKTVSCNVQACQGDCVVSDWATYNTYSLYTAAMGNSTYVVSQSAFAGSCTVSCGEGTRKIYRKVLSPPLNGGAPCPLLVDTAPCNLQACPGDCVVSQWTYYDTYGSYYAVASQYPDLYPEYAFQGSCSKSCGGGVRTHYRFVLTQATSAGRKCPPLTKTATCSPLPCPQDCVVGEWTTYNNYNVYAVDYANTPGFYQHASIWPGICTKSCDGGIRYQFRKVLQQSAYGGRPCPELSNPIPCQQNSCPIDAVVSSWAVYDDFGHYVAAMGPYAYSVDAWLGTCSKTCGSGVRRAYRYIVTEAQFGGKAAPALYKEVACNTKACPGDCVLSEWTSYTNYQDYFADFYATGNYLSRDLFHGGCSKSCDGGVIYHYRKVLTAASFGGAPCEDLSKTVVCNKQACPIDGTVGQWTAYDSYTSYYAAAGPTGYFDDSLHFQGVCSASCGGGFRYLYRLALTIPANGGAPLPALSKKVVCNTQPCAQDCVLSQWGYYDNYESYYQAMVGASYSYIPRTAFQGSCSKSCGSGDRTIYRAVVTPSQNGGKPCDPLFMTVKCNVKDCPGDCVVSQWSTYDSYTDYFNAYHTTGFYEPEFAFRGVCSKTCGAGTRLAYRQITTKPLAGGVACPVLTKEIKCNTLSCPNDCLVSQWSTFSPDVNSHLGTSLGSQGSQCTATCGGGVQSYFRTVVRPAQNNGLECPPLLKTVACNTKPCPVDALVSQWATYDSYESYYAAQSGFGSVYDQNNWRGVCSKTCGSGVRLAFRYVITPPENGGVAIPVLQKEVKCNVQACPGACVVSEWTSFDSYLTYYQQMSPYGSFDSKENFRGICSLSCNKGTRAQYRYVKTPALNGGAACPDLVRFVDCNEQPCPVDGVVGSWTSYDSYNAYYQAFVNSGYLIDANSWNGQCTKSCGGGVRYLFRPVVSFPKYGGKALPTLYKEIPCNVQDCPVDCVVSEWVNYDGTQLTFNGQGSALFKSSCSKTCGGGYRAQIRSVLKYPTESGQPCPALVQTVACNNEPCPVDCVVSQWAVYSSYNAYFSVYSSSPYYLPQSGFTGLCSATCGQGKQTSYRFVTQDVKYGGKACPALTKTVICNAKPCPGDCVVSDWAGYDSYTQVGLISTYTAADRKRAGVCSKSCGTGQKLLFRQIITQPTFGGAACPPPTTVGLVEGLVKSVSCNEQPCPVDAVVGEWAEYSSYESYFLAFYGTGPLPSSGVWSGLCSATCGGGVRTVYRQLITPSAFGGKEAPALSKTVVCNPTPCPVDCVLSDWAYYAPDQYEYSIYGTCTKSCGTGSIAQYRTVIQAASGGLECPVDSLTRTVDCNTQDCPVDAVVSSWVAYSSYGAYYSVFSQYSYVILDESVWNRDGVCSASCGGGLRVEYRYIQTPAANGGKPAPPLSRKVRCGTLPCPSDCVLSEWVIFGAQGGYTLYKPFVNDPSDVTCSKSCGSGQRTISRNIVKAAANGGAACGPQTMTVLCNTQPCPIDAVLSEWLNYTPNYAEYSTIGQCSASCGNGTRAQFRTVEVEAKYGGRAAGALSRNVECNTQPCPSDCRVSSWTNYASSNPKYQTQGRCSVSCGGGTFEQYRTVVAYNQEGGRACPDLTRTLTCNTQGCPGDCIVSQWNYYDSSNQYSVPGVSAPSSCSASCGGGSQTVFRKVITPTAYTGKPCPSLSKTISCNVAACPVDCQVSSWTDYAVSHSEYLSRGVCSKTCGLADDAGVRGQFRIAKVVAQNGGKACPPLSRNVKCNEIPCPQDCTVSQWNVYDASSGQVYGIYTPNAQSVCSVSCGGGVRKLSRTVQTPSLFGGAACPVLTKEVPCNTQPCPIDCVASDWVTYNPIASNGAIGNLDNLCSASCDGGWRRVVRQISVYPQYGGVECGDIVKDVPCNTQKCPVDAVVSDWSFFKPTYNSVGVVTGYTALSTCSVTCGGGYRTQFRTIVTQAGFGGRPAPALTQQVPCGTSPCPGDAVLSEWSDYSSTNIDNLGSVSASTVGDSLSGSVPSSCSKTCGGGMKTQFRKVIQVAQNGGNAAGPLTRLVDCNTQPCPVDCTVSEWAFYNTADAGYAYYGRCSKTCGGGETRAYRVVTRYSSYGGKACPDLTKVVPCNEFACPVDCVVGSWAQYESYDDYYRQFRTQKTFLDSFNWGGLCSKTCGSGERQQYREVITAPLNGGTSCPPLSRSVDCNTMSCPVDCVVSNWATYGPGYNPSSPYNVPSSAFCSKTCGDGTATQYRTILTNPLFGGKACPALTQEVACNLQPCPNDCLVGDWADAQPSALYNGCSKSCGQGFKPQIRRVIRAPTNNGADCPLTSRNIPCNEQACPVDCVVTEWSVITSFGVTQCSKTCGGGIQVAVRKITTQPSDGGKACPALTQEFPCNVEPCPCPNLACTYVCIEGYIRDQNGCPTCQCVGWASIGSYNDIPYPVPGPSPSPFPGPSPSPSPVPGPGPVPGPSPSPSPVPSPSPYPGPSPSPSPVPGPSPYPGPSPSPSPVPGPSPSPYPTAAPTTASTAASTTASTKASTAASTTASTAASTTASTYAPTTASTAASTDATAASTAAPTTASTYAPTTASTAAPTTASTYASTTASTAASTDATTASTYESTTASTAASTDATTASTAASTDASTTQASTESTTESTTAYSSKTQKSTYPTKSTTKASQPTVDPCSTLPCPLQYTCLNVPSPSGYPYTCVRTSPDTVAATPAASSSNGSANTGTVVMIVGAVIAAVMIVVFVAIYRSRRASAVPIEEGQTAPEFANPLYATGKPTNAQSYEPVDF